MRSFYESKYWVKRWFEIRFDSFVRLLLPRYIVKQSMLKASHRIKPNEEIPAVTFVEVFGRVIDNS